MTHLVFHEADSNVLKQAMELDESLQGPIIQLHDDYAVGPIANIYTEEGMAARKAWWREVLAGTDFEKQLDAPDKDDVLTVQHLTEQLQGDAAAELWIWAAQNQHDVSGYYWLISQLKPYQGRILLLYLNNLPFLNEKGQLFYPTAISQILPREMIKAKKLARRITTSEMEVDPDEWTRLCNENKGIRLLEGGKKLIQKDYDYFDAELKTFITNDWQKAGKIIHQFLHKSKHKISDAFLLWRLKQLLQTDVYDVQGEVKHLKDFEIKKKTGELFATAE
ncbi:MAG: DUF1835 domain-containing protein [Lacibacter sp.]|jgi:hypothetical protein